MATKQFTTADGRRVGSYKSRDRYTVIVEDPGSRIPGIGSATLEPAERWRLIALLCPELQRLRAAAAYALRELSAEAPTINRGHCIEFLDHALAFVPEHWKDAEEG